MKAKPGLIIASAMLFGLALAIMGDVGGTAVTAQEKKDKKEKNPLEGKKGVAIGTLTDKGPNFIEVKAAGEEKGRRYVPQWVGGNPDKGGGPDKKLLKVFSELKVGSRVEVEWLFEERLRVLSVKVLKKTEDDKK
jgi:hypothetical protein